MNKIDELLDGIQELDVEITHNKDRVSQDGLSQDTPCIEEIAQEEIERITKLALEKAEIMTKGSPKKVLSKKRLHLFIAAAVIIAAFSLIMASESISVIFKDLFGNNEYVKENGRVIGKSDTQNGVTVTVKGVVGDEHSAWIIYDIIKDNGEAFKGDYVHFSGASLNFGGAGSGASSIGQSLADKRNTVTCTMHINRDQSIAGKQAIMTFVDLIDDVKNEKQFELNLGSYLKEHPELIKQELVENAQRNLADPDELLYVLPRKGLNVPIAPDTPASTLDNIGFVDGKLHMIIKSDTKDDIKTYGFVRGAIDFELIRFKSATRTADPQYRSGNGSENGMYTYLVYNIKDMAELEKFKPYIIYPDIIRGKWQVSFKMDYGYKSKTVNPNIAYDNNSKIKEIVLSSMSLKVSIEGKTPEGDSERSKVDVLLKDGSKLGKRSSGTTRSDEETIFRIDFLPPIDIEDVEYVVVNGQKIKMSSTQ